MFRHTITLNRVRDTIDVMEGGKRLTLTVDEDSTRLVSKLTTAQKALKTLSDSVEEEDAESVALLFASALFGEKQGKELMDFYSGDPGATIEICGKYFSERLAKLITKVQKKKK